jgi:circadian clock protein KaiC
LAVQPYQRVFHDNFIMAHTTADPAALILTGIEGLDDILEGGFTPNRLYLFSGNPGSGKTTLALRLLIKGAEAGARGLYIALSESAEEIKHSALSHGWDLDAMEGLEISEVIPAEDLLDQDAQFTIFHPSEVELTETTKSILSEVRRVSPSLVVLDSLSEMRLLAQGSLRYRRQILALKQYFAGIHCTVFLLDDGTSEADDLHLQSIAHGVIDLEQLAPDYGAERRRLKVLKMRGRSYRGGYHDFIIERGGLRVFPRLVASEHGSDFTSEETSTGLPKLDMLLGGGLRRGTNTLLLGPAGSGKSTIMAQMVHAFAVQRGENAAIFSFEESLGTLLARTEALGIPLEEGIQQEKISVQFISAAELSPGEFAQRVRNAVEVDGARIVAIDSLNGYINAMPEERFLIIQLHELLTYLGQRGVVTILVMAQHGLIGQEIFSPVDASYLSDTVILLRFYEVQGEVRQAISVVKKRSGPHERTIRDISTSTGTLTVGEPLRELQGVLGGTPSVCGARAPVPAPSSA